jgi:hypothetical protein
MLDHDAEEIAFAPQLHHVALVKDLRLCRWRTIVIRSADIADLGAGAEADVSSKNRCSGSLGPIVLTAN